MRWRSLLFASAVWLAASAVSSAAIAAAPGEFSNPIAAHPEDSAAAVGNSSDPWMVTFAGHYYLTTTRNRHIEIRRARQLAGLASAPATTVWPRAGASEPAERCCQFWAPEFHRLRGPHGIRWYMLYSATNRDDLATHEMHVLESARDDPLGPYAYKGKLALNGWAIDATYFSQRGRLYLLHSGQPVWAPFGQKLYITPLSNPYTVSGAPLQISEASFPWESVVGPINEGPIVLRRRNKVHIIYSASSCITDGYKLGRLTIAATDDPMNPAVWAHAKAPQPVFQTSQANDVWGPGHNGFFKSRDGREDWIVYHATDAPGVTCLSGLPRTTRAQRFSWNADDTPNFGTPQPLSQPLAPPSGDRSLTRQLETARVVRNTAPHTIVGGDEQLVGGMGTSLAASRPGAAVTYSLALPRGPRLRVYARMKVGPAQGRVRLEVLDRGRRGPAAAHTANAYAPVRGYREFTLGETTPQPTGSLFRFTVTGKDSRSAGYLLGLDQLRFVAGSEQEGD